MNSKESRNDSFLRSMENELEDDGQVYLKTNLPPAILIDPKNPKGGRINPREVLRTIAGYALFAGLITGGLLAAHYLKGAPSLTVALAAGLGAPAAIMGGFRIKTGVQYLWERKRKEEDRLQEL